MVKKKAAESAFNVYEVAIETGIEDYHFEQHVRARDEDEAKAKVQAAQGKSATITEVRFRRECTDAENADEARKAGGA